MKPVEMSGKVSTDQSGRFPTTSSKGNKYLILLHEYDSNDILAETMKIAAAHDFCFAEIFHGLGEYGVGVVLMEYHEVLVSFSVGGGETTGLVSGDFSAYFRMFHVDPIGSDARLVG